MCKGTSKKLDLSLTIKFVTGRNTLLRHVMVATALANLVGGERRSLTRSPFGVESMRLAKKGGRPMTVLDALRCFGQYAMEWKERSVVLPSRPETIFLHIKDGLNLPEEVKNKKFVVGAIDASRRLAKGEQITLYHLFCKQFRIRSGS